MADPYHATSVAHTLRLFDAYGVVPAPRAVPSTQLPTDTSETGQVSGGVQAMETFQQNTLFPGHVNRMVRRLNAGPNPRGLTGFGSGGSNQPQSVTPRLTTTR